jgi:hypothetical protein
MPTAFLILPYHEPYETLYQQVLEPILIEHGFRVVRADMIQQSSVIIDDVHRSIQKADIVIVEATEMNPNVYYELGFAVAHNRETILLTQEGKQPPFDTQQRRHLSYGSDLDATRETFRKWLAASVAYRSHAPRTDNRVLQRGDVFPGILDATVFLDSPDLISEELLHAQVRDGCMLACKFSYATERGTQHWLRLCEDPLYTVFTESVQLFSAKATEILAICGEAFLTAAPDVISLGPGNGYKDRLILSALARELDHRGVPDSVFYYPIDVSLPMLSAAQRTILQDVSLQRRVRIKAIHSDFVNITAFRPVFDYRPEPNLFLFLGNTLGNIQDEINFLQRVRSAMHPGDVLILEVRLRTGQLVLGGRTEDQNGLSFSALRILRVPYTPDRLVHRVEDTVSQIPGTQTVATLMHDVEVGDETYDEVFLSCVNYYDRDELRKKLTGTTLNFEILAVFDTPQLGVFVLRKPARNNQGMPVPLVIV